MEGVRGVKYKIWIRGGGGGVYLVYWLDVLATEVFSDPKNKKLNYPSDVM